MEGLELKPGLSFLNIGSGTGYLSTLAGLILGTSGISHGVEVHPSVVEYAVKKISQFIENSPILDDFDFCEPKFYHGNGLCLTPLLSCYDRVYCGAGCPEEYENYFKRLIKVGGVLVMPLNDTLQQVRRVGENKWVTRSLLNVSFATLRTPSREEAAQHVKLDKQTPVRLQLLSRAVVRCAMRRGVLRRHPELREAPRAPPPAACPRRICIPIEPGGAVEGLNVLHDLDGENGANEMNALLSLVISMGHNRVAGALRFDRVDDSSTDSSDSSDDEDRDPEPEEQDGASRDEAEPANPQPENHNAADDSSDKKRNAISDSDDDKPNTRSKVIKTDPKTGNKRQTRRPRRPRSGDGPDEPRFPPGCRELLSYRYEFDEPSTSSKEAKTSTSEELTDSSERKSLTSTDDDAHCSKETKRSTPPGVPSEVEIDLGSKMAPEASTSQMDWDDIQTDTAEVSDDDTDDTKSKAKRQKLDSGIGETTPSGSSPTSHKSKTESESEQSYGSPAAGSPHDGRSEEECAELTAHAARRRRRIARGGDARRVRLSLLMKQAVRELPLPHALKKFVNLGRCFEF
ncbi:dentin sialophosphoprotein-like isoform X2 [Nymphalis io]|nr:dentin sialophosphoprotein-like isoform X2 [Nymphalis io]